MANILWKFILVNSKDLSQIGELDQARDKNLNLGLNRPGSASFSYSYYGRLAEDIEVISTGIIAYRYNSQTEIYDAVWSGYVNEINEDAEAESMSVSCVGWFERLNKRIAKQEIMYTSQYDNDIILGTGLVTPTGTTGITCPSGILPIANRTTTATEYVIPSGSYPAGAYPLPVVSGSSPNTLTLLAVGTYDNTTDIPASALTKKTIKVEQDQSFGEAITNLTQQENGPDIDVNPITRELNVYLKRGNVKEDVYFGYNWGPSNIRAFSKQIGTEQFANNLIGRANGVVPVMLATDTDSLNAYGLWESVINLTQNAPNQNVLEYFTAAEYLFTSTPLVTYSITPYPFTRGSSVPEPFVDYIIGDQVNFVANRPPRIDPAVDSGQFRVFGMSISIENDGNETIGELQIYAS
jgi:hypothetical protein